MMGSTNNVIIYVSTKPVRNDNEIREILETLIVKFATQVDVMEEI